MASEIVEEGVESIEMSQSAMCNRYFNPLNGRVKWFTDELNQLWTKFSTDDSGVIHDRVWPAHLVVEVVYRKN